MGMVMAGVRRKDHCRLVVCGLSACVAFSVTQAQARDWKTEAGFSVSSIYSDNGSSDDESGSSEFVTKVSPNLLIKRDGGRARFSFIGSAELTAGGEDVDRFSPRISSSFDTELIENFAYLDTNLQVSQRSIDALGPTNGDDPLNRNSNRTETYTYRIEPYLQKTYQNGNRFKLATFFQGQESSDDSVSGADTSGAEFEVARELAGSKATVSLSADYRDTDTDNSASSFSTIQAGLGYQFTEHFALTGTIGRENNDFETVRDTNDGRIWKVGAVWTPSSRTRLNVGYVDRFFGSTPTLELSHKLKRSVLTLSYSRDLSDSNSLIEGQSTFSDRDAAGDPVDPFTQLVQQLSANSVTEGAFINEKLKLGWSVSGRRSKFGLDISYSNLDYEDGRDDEEVSELGLSFSRQISRVSTLNVGLIGTRSSRGTEEADEYELRLGWDRRLDDDTSVGFLYQFIDRDANVGDSYQENRIQLRFTTRL
ncbi:TIGR03016 family PEP-CTERM system-associated outer membrane protein [Neptunomonas marina]|nr:TIGR03016 family PEP-CTERM system-associated outer membrane protein [Neptunomonas marina]